MSNVVIYDYSLTCGIQPHKYFLLDKFSEVIQKRSSKDNNANNKYNE